MGLRPYDLDRLQYALDYQHLNYKGLKMMQFGDQTIRSTNQPAKEYFQNLGAEVISIDINGQRGSLPIDLSKVLSWPYYKNYFDVVTNYGTIEHIKDDLIGYANADYFLKKQGILINIAPVDTHKYRYHRNTHKYNTDWYVNWANKNNYTILENLVTTIEERGAPWVYCSLIKE